ncbi:hypothetical protein [Galbibacter sp. BG1]
METAGNSQSNLQKYLNERLNQLQYRKSQLVIAEEAGFANPNFISMLKKGRSKLALDRVPSMAKALEVDPAYLFRLALEQFFDESVLKELMPLFNSVITENEKEILDTVREASQGSNPDLTVEVKEKLSELFAPKV